MKRNILVLAALCLALSAQAQRLRVGEQSSGMRLRVGERSSETQRSEQEMQAIAAEHLYGQRGKSSGTAAARPEKLMQNDMVAAYGDRYNGTVFVSRDSWFAPVLGYTDRPLQMEEPGEGLRWWIETISATMRQKRQANDMATIYAPRTLAPSHPRTPASPLLTTLWAQGEPYNDKCPVADSWSKRRAQTGCVATAMAQVMNYHQYPAQGTGTGYYTLNGSSSKKNGRISSTYDWANMKDKYSSGAAKDETTDAVATLMYDCGLASHMAYALQASGTTSPVAAAGLANHFAYDSLALHCTYRLLDNSDRWLQTIYSEIDGQRPVMYMSTDATYGAHCFVVDGYQADNGYLHVNWGWSGEADGYFDFFNLNPKTAYQQAYGMEGYDFSQDAASQSMITGIMPPDATERPYESYWAMADEEVITVVGDSITLQLPTLINYHFLTFYGIVGLCIQNVKTGHSPIQPFYYTAWSEQPVPSLMGWNAMEVPYYKYVTDQLDDGEYDLFLCSWHETSIGKTNPQYIRFPDKGDGNENYNIWRMTKKDGHLSIQKNKVPLHQEEQSTAIRPAERDARPPRQQSYDLQGRPVGQSATHGRSVYIVNGRKVIQ